MLDDWLKWYQIASKAGYSSNYNWHKGRWEIKDRQSNIVYTQSVKSPNWDPGMTPQQLLGEYYRDWGPHVTTEPTKPRTIEVGEFANIEDIGKPLGAQVSFTVGTPQQSRGFFQKKGTAFSDADAKYGSRQLPPGTYVPADAIDDFSYADFPDKTGFFKKLKNWGQIKRKAELQPLPPEKLQGSRYNPQLYSYGESRVYLDLETVGTRTDRGSILSYAAIRKAKNLDTGHWDIVDKRTRYYFSTPEDKLLKDERGNYVYEDSIAISGLSDANIKLRRKQQLARYSKHFGERELRGLLNYIGNSQVVGHNIAQFDWPKLFNMATYPGFVLPERLLPKGGLVDMYHIAEGTRGQAPGLNTNSKLFTLAYGMTPEQAGFTAHDALEDVQITALVDEAVQKSASRMGFVNRYLAHRPGLSSQWRDSMINGITEVRGMTDIDRDKLINITGDAENPKGAAADYLDYDIAANSLDGRSVPREASLQTLQASDFQTSIKVLGDTVKILSQSMSEFRTVHTGIKNLSLIKEAGKFSTPEDRRAFLKTSSAFANASESVMEEAEKQAEMIYNRNTYGSATAPKKPEAPRGWRGSWEDILNARRNRDAEQYTQGGFGIPISSSLEKDHLYDGSSKLVKAFEKLTDTVKGADKVINNVWGSGKWYNVDRLYGKSREEAEGVLQSSAYFAGPFKNAYIRFGQSAIQQATSEFQHKRAELSLWSTVAGAIPAGIVTAVTGSPILGAGVLNGVKGITQWAGGISERKVVEYGQAVQSRINLWSGTTELILTPLKLFGQGLKLSIGLFNKLSNSLQNVIAGFNTLGLPLTNLTGVTYGDLVRSYSGDAMIGARAGTINSAYNGLASAQQNLYTFGALDRNRVIASAMTGTFGSVYANGGDSQAQYAETVNSIFAQMQNASPQRKAQLMHLAQVIDPTMVTSLQQMTNLSRIDSRFGDYRNMQSGAWARGFNIYTAANFDNAGGDVQRARYTRAGMEYNSMRTSIGESVNAIGLTLWNAFGKDLMSGLNDVVYRIAKGDWRGALSDIKTTASKLWSKISKAMFGEQVTFDDGITKLKAKLTAWIDPILAVLEGPVTKALGWFGARVLEMFAHITDVMWPWFADLINRFSTVHWDFDWTKLAKGENPLSIYAPGEDFSESKYRQASAKEKAQMRAYIGSGVLHSWGARGYIESDGMRIDANTLGVGITNGKFLDYVYPMNKNQKVKWSANGVEYEGTREQLGKFLRGAGSAMNNAGGNELLDSSILNQSEVAAGLSSHYNSFLENMNLSEPLLRMSRSMENFTSATAATSRPQNTLIFQLSDGSKLETQGSVIKGTGQFAPLNRYNNIVGNSVRELGTGTAQ